MQNIHYTLYTKNTHSLQYQRNAQIQHFTYYTHTRKICTYICKHIHMHARLLTQNTDHMQTRTDARAQIHTHINAKYTYTYANAHVYTHTCTCILYTNIHIHTNYTHIYIHIYIIHKYTQCTNYKHTIHNARTINITHT